MPHKRLSPRLALLRSALSSNHQPFSEKVEATVGLLLSEEADGIETLLIQRAERHGDPWSGQIGLPGGRAKDSDGSIRGTLLREVEEEVGIDLSREGQELGALSVGHPMRRLEMRVQPWVYLLDQKPTVRLGSEVSSAFWVALASLPSSKTTAEVVVRDGHVTVDCFQVTGKIVWGYTYRVLTEFLQMPGITGQS